MKFKFLIFFSMFVFFGCSKNNIGLDNVLSNSSSVCYSEPSWVLNPPVEKGFIYGVGIAPQNFHGQQAQRKSAIAKAINEIATQFNTTVNSELMTKSVVHNGRGYTNLNSVSFQTVNGEKVSAIIIKSCQNPNNGYLYILMKAKK